MHTNRENIQHKIICLFNKELELCELSYAKPLFPDFFSLMVYHPVYKSDVECSKLIECNMLITDFYFFCQANVTSPITVVNIQDLQKSSIKRYHFHIIIAIRTAMCFGVFYGYTYPILLLDNALGSCVLET